MTGLTHRSVLEAAERIRDGIVATPCTRAKALADIVPSTF